MKHYYPHENVAGVARPTESEIGPWFCVTNEEQGDDFGEFLEVHLTETFEGVVFRKSEFHHGAIQLGSCVILDVDRVTQVRDRLNELIAVLEEKQP